MIRLSPIDHVFTGVGAYPLEFVFAYGGRMDAGRLAESLRLTLEVFPAVGSRLVRLDGRLVRPRARRGRVRARGRRIDVAASPTRPIAPPSWTPVETVPGRPLARVRLTQTPGGSVLGVGLSHAVVDGFSYFYFLSAWSRVFHGRDVPPPWLDRAASRPGGRGPWPREPSDPGA